MKKIIAIIYMVVISNSANAALLNVESMSVIGGETYLAGTTSQLLPGDVGPVIMGTYQGSPACCSPDAKLTTLVYYQANFLGWAGLWTSQYGFGDDTADPPPSAYVDTVNSLIHVDFSSLTWSWNGYNIHIGTNDMTGTYDASTGVYDISWSSLFTQTPFRGQEISFHLTGIATVSAVPIPAAIWLFGSGLLVLAGLVRRRH